MAIYNFRSADGEIIELSYSMKDAPPIGSKIQHEGKEYERVMSTGMQFSGDFKPYKVYTKCPTIAGECGLKFDPKDKRPIIQSRAEERRVAKTMGYEAE